jgi:predicted DNA-binding transcriptional regulator AlpA
VNTEISRSDTRDKLLTPEQVSEWTGIRPAALAQLRYKGTGPKYRALTAKTIRYTESDVQAWIDAAERTITGSAA